MDGIEELPPPPGAHAASRAMELARVWIVDRQVQFRLSGDLWDDRGMWGILMMDLARHVSEAYQGQGRNGAEVLAQVLRAFDAERSHPTDEPEQLT